MEDAITRTVPPELDGERFDKALAVLLGVSRAVARDLIDAGATVDGTASRASEAVSEGSTIRSRRVPDPETLVPERVDFGLLYEDRHLLVVDKPAGLVVHPGSARHHGTLAAGLLERYPELEGVGEPLRWGLVHRLDKETSGVMVVARTDDAYESLREMIRRREVVRVYTALVHGVLNVPTGTIDAPIGRDPARPTRRALTHGGKPAVTHYAVLDTYPSSGCTLLSVRLETGRTHQIRVHLSAIGHSVVGDRTYGARTSKAASPRQFLHATRLSFAHPATGAAIDIESPLPPELQAVLETVAAG